MVEGVCEVKETMTLALLRVSKHRLVIGLLMLLTAGGWFTWRTMNRKGESNPVDHIPVTVSSLHFPRLGTVHLYSTHPHPSQVLLLLSGEQGWDRTMTTLARKAAAVDALVAGIDLPHYLRALSQTEDWCSYPGADLQGLNKLLQKQFAFADYTLPILVGSEMGAAFVYAAMAQAPPDMFQGVISLGFCPELTLRKPLCEWNGLRWKSPPQGTRYVMAPASTLPAPWVVLHTAKHARCATETVSQFTRLVPQANVAFVDLSPHAPGAGDHEASQFTRAFTMFVQKSARTADPASAVVKDLPLIEHPVSSGTSTTLAIIYSGDGGWASIDRELGDTLASRGVATVGVNSLRYFWTARTPESGGRDLARLLQHYLATWHKETALLIGYSLGADVLPFFASRLPPDLLAKVKLIALLSPSHAASFEFHVTDWLEETSTQGAHLVLPEIEKLKGTNLLCMYGAEEEDAACRGANPRFARVVQLAGGHHFDGSYEQVANTILHAAGIGQ